MTPATQYVEYTTEEPTIASQIIARIAEQQSELSRELTVEEYRQNQLLLADVRVIPASVTCTPVSYYNVPCEWVHRRWIKADSPKIIIYFHGGSWMFGGLESARPVSVMLARDTNMRVLMVDYRLAPEHPYPAGLVDCYNIYNYLLRGGFASESIGIFGDSAGGNLSLALINRLKREGLPLPACVGLASPVTDMRHTSALITSGDNLLYTNYNGEEQSIFSLYLGDEYEDKRELDTLSPITADLSGLPPVLIHSGETEPITYDNIEYIKKITQSGGDGYLKVWKDMFHDFTVVGRTLRESRLSIQEMANFFRKHIS